MLFNSHIFILFFLPITLLGYYWLGARFGSRICKVWLVAASLFYYAWWNPAYLAILVASILVNYGFGFALSSTADSVMRKRVLILGIVLNLAALAYYKYANFFVDNIQVWFGLDWTLKTIILPLAISFFTFQQIAFLCDAAKGETREYRFMDYCLFVTFFPQLIAGPIVHHKEMMPQFAREDTYRMRWDNISIGLTLFTIGLFKKVMIADSIAGYSTPVFTLAQGGEFTPGAFDAWSAALAYTFQIYFDFSGYSDMALGLGRLFGIRLPMNFFSPYKSASIIEFWRRWHITLSRFLRDYLYFPLGGNRKGPVRRQINLMITMLLGGFWHGAGWTFIIWGGLHGLYLVLNHFWRMLMGKKDDTMAWPVRAVCVVVTFFFVVVSWVFFRAEAIEPALTMLKGMAGMNEAELVVNKMSAYYWIIAGLIISWALPNAIQVTAAFQPSYEIEREDQAPMPRWQRWMHWQPNRIWATAMAVVLALCVLSLSKVTEFLYFQF